MKRVCYWCHRHMGEKEGGSEDGIFYSICDSCSQRMRLEERLPELVFAVAALRKKRSQEQYQSVGAVAGKIESMVRKDNKVPNYAI